MAGLLHICGHDTRLLHPAPLHLTAPTQSNLPFRPSRRCPATTSAPAVSMKKWQTTEHHTPACLTIVKGLTTRGYGVSDALRTLTTELTPCSWHRCKRWREWTRTYVRTRDTGRRRLLVSFQVGEQHLAALCEWRETRTKISGLKIPAAIMELSASEEETKDKSREEIGDP